MVAPTLKTPRIVNADKPSIVLDPGTFVFNNDTDVPEYVNLSGSFVQLTPGGTSVNVIHQQLWVNNADGQDTNDGGLYTPFKTYSAAVAHAKLTASPTNRFQINIIGDMTSASPVLIPYADLYFYSGTWTVTGGLGLDNSWDTVVNNEIVTITGMKLSGFWTFSWIGNTGNFIRFINCDHGLTTSGNFLSNPGSANALVIINDISPFSTSYSSNLFLTNSPSILFNAKVAGEIRYDLVSNGYTLDHYLLNSIIPFGIVVKKTVPNTSTQTIHVRGTPMPVNSPVLEDDLSNVEIDTVSYLNDPTFFITGTYANMITKDLNGIRQQLWVNEAVGNDLNSGSISAPFKTYDAARTFAASKVSPTNRYLINVRGNQTASGDILINPYIDLNFDDCVFTSGDAASGIALDASWAGVSNEKVYITGFRPVTAIGLNISFDATTNFSNWIVFTNCNFAQCPSGGVNSGGGVGSSGNDNGVAIFGDSNPLSNNFPSGFSVFQVKSRIENMNFGSGVNYALGEDDYFIHHYISNCYMDGLNNQRFSGNGSQYVHIRNCHINNPIILDCQLGQIYIDSNSYSQPLSIGGSNSYADVIIDDITDGILMSTFSPGQYSFASGNYANNALTGFMKGIDNALGGKATLIPYQEVTSLTFVMSANNEYTANNAAVVSLTLPLTSPVGSKIIVNGKGAGGWRIDQQNAGHIIHVGANSSTLGNTGSVGSNTQFASITLVCVTADNVWVAQGGEGPYTIV